MTAAYATTYSYNLLQGDNSVEALLNWLGYIHPTLRADGTMQGAVLAVANDRRYTVPVIGFPVATGAALLTDESGQQTDNGAEVLVVFPSLAQAQRFEKYQYSASDAVIEEPMRPLFNNVGRGVYDFRLGQLEALRYKYPDYRDDELLLYILCR